MKPINSAPIPADRRQAGQELARLASFPELNPSPILEIDLDGCITYINPFAQKLFPDITEKGVNHPYLAAWQDFVEKMLKEGALHVVREVQVENQYFQQSVYSVKEYQCLRVYGLDITKRKQAEADRKEREEELYRLNRTLRAISNCNQSMMRAENEYALMEEVCKIVVED